MYRRGLRASVSVGTLAFLLVSTGCRKGAREAAEGAWPELQSGLVRREAKLQSHRLVGSVLEAGQQADFDVSYRAPNLVMATLGKPPKRSFAHDGELLYQLDHEGRTFTTFELRMSRADRALFLAQLFHPLIPEGLRTPIVPKPIALRQAPAPNGGVAWEVTVRDSEGDVTTTYWLRPESLDFLGKRSQAAGGQAEMRVLDELCDDGLRLCVPKSWLHRANGQDGARAVITDLKLNPDLPEDAFRPVPPSGYAVVRQTLTDPRLPLSP